MHKPTSPEGSGLDLNPGVYLLSLNEEQGRAVGKALRGPGPPRNTGYHISRDPPIPDAGAWPHLGGGATPGRRGRAAEVGAAASPGEALT